VNIYESMALVMADVDHVAKRDRNEAQKFLFRGVDAVVNAVGPVLRKHKVIVIPSVESVEYASIVSRNGGSLTSCRLVATYTFHAEDGTSIPSRVAAEAFDSGDKATPKAMSVAFRTALLQALTLPTDDPDPDGQTFQTAAPSPKASAAAPPETSGGTRRMSRETSGITAAQSTAMHAALTKAGKGARDLGLAYISEVVGRPVESSKQLTKQEASKVIDSLKGGPPAEYTHAQADKDAAADEALPFDGAA
jgi:hypothetical protein